MLSKLYIENIAVIECAEIDFCPGLNILTGETGAGKSILVDSIMAVLGQRTSKELVRTGASSGFVSAEFSDIDKSVLDELALLGIAPEDNTLMLGREIKADGRSSFKLNGRPSSASVLREVGRLLINIHGQHDSGALLDPQKHGGYLDSTIPDRSIIDDFQKIYGDYVAARKALQKLDMDESEKARRIDVLKFEISDIEAAQPAEGEYEECIRQRDIYLNSERIGDALSEIASLLTGDSDQFGAVFRVQRSTELLGDISDCINDAQPLRERMTDAAYELEDIAGEISTIADGLDFDANALEELESRISVLRRLIKKYGSEQAAIEYCDNAKRELEQIELSDERREQLRRQCIALKKETIDAAMRYSRARKSAAALFSQRVSEELSFLDMPSVTFEVKLEKKELNESGAESVEFMISTNPGEPPKSISRIASGGELSRIMLAIKNVLADKDDIGTLIFDEVDTGVSGRAAHKIGVKLKSVSVNRQIICITHLAQIAANADAHMLIEKKVSDGRTYTQVRRLSFDERIHELARINAGDRVTDAMLATARELLISAGVVPDTQ